MNVKILLLFLSVIASCSIRAQIITAGTISSFAGSVNNSTISINYSVGEVAIKTISNSSVSLTQEFLQPKLVITTGIVEVSDNDDVLVYPNPSVDYVFIKSNDLVKWEIFDSSGKSILIGDTTKIETSQLANGIYYMELLSKNKGNKKTIKLIKN
jgi:hypothetical protein